MPKPYFFLIRKGQKNLKTYLAKRGHAFKNPILPESQISQNGKPTVIPNMH
jgi:hypothetical protein